MSLRYNISWNTEKALLSLSYFLMGLIFFTPLLYSSHLLFGITTVRVFTFRIAVELLFMLYLFLVIEDRKYAPKSSLTLWSLIGLFLSLTLAGVFNGTIIYSFWGNFLRMDGLLNFGHLIIFFLVSANLIKSLRAWQALLQVILFGGFVSSLVGLSQNFGQPLLLVSGGGSRITAATGSAVYLGAYLVIVIFISVFLLLEKKIKDLSILTWLFIGFDVLLIAQEIFSRLVLDEAGILTDVVANLPIFFIWLLFQAYCVGYYFWYKRYQYNIFLSLLILIYFWSLLLTQAKGALLSLIAGLAVWLFVLIFRYLTEKKQKSVLVGFLLILVALGFFLTVEFRRQYIYPESPGVFNSLIANPSFYNRSLVWGAAWQAIKDKPIFGWGAENFDLAFDKYFPDALYQSDDSRVWFDKAHNQYLEYFVEGGLVALIFYLLIFFSFSKKISAWYRVRNDGITPLVLIGLLSAYVVQSLFYFDTIYVSVPLIFILALADQRGAVSNDRHKSSGSRKIYFLNNLFKLPYVLQILIFLGTILFIYNFNLRQINANLYFTKIENELAFSAFSDFDLIKKLGIETDHLPSLGKMEMRDRYADIVKKYTLNAQNEISGELIMMAESHLIKNSQKRTGAVLPYVKLANYYYFMGPFNPVFLDKGIAVVKKAQAVNSQRDQLIYFLGEFYLQQGEVEKGLSYYKIVADKLPNVAEAQTRYYSALLRADHQQDAEVQKSRIISTHPDWEDLFRS